MYRPLPHRSTGNLYMDSIKMPLSGNKFYRFSCLPGMGHFRINLSLFYCYEHLVPAFQALTCDV